MPAAEYDGFEGAKGLHRPRAGGPQSTFDHGAKLGLRQPRRFAPPEPGRPPAVARAAALSPRRRGDDSAADRRGAGIRQRRGLRLTPPRYHNEDEADDGEDRAAKHPRPLVDHEARCRPMDDAGALPDPQQPHEAREDAEVQAGGP